MGEIWNEALKHGPLTPGANRVLKWIYHRSQPCWFAAAEPHSTRRPRGSNALLRGRRRGDWVPLRVTEDHFRLELGDSVPEAGGPERQKEMDCRASRCSD